LATQVQVHLFPMLVPCSHHLPAPLTEHPPRTSATSVPSNPSRKGRTQAQNTWGRRPFPAKGARLQAACATQ
jgi:hypothetical protein